MARKTLSIHFGVSFLTLMLMVSLFALPGMANIEDHITRTESGFYYTVQKGDTLWDLSKKFEDSPWEWPGLWSKNPQIANPHLIYPGQKILIFKKEWEGREKPEQVVQMIPKTPEQTLAPQPAGEYYTCLEIDRLGFIRKEPIPPAGIIFKSLNQNMAMSSQNRMYIRPASGASAMNVGDKFIAYHTVPVQELDSRAVMGYQHILGGIITITKLNPGYAVGIVDDAFSEIKVNDSVMPYHPKPTQILLKEGKPGLEARLIKAERENTMIGENDIVFVDKGENDGVEAGQSYSIYEQDTAIINPEDRTPVLLAPEYIGDLLVVHTEPTTATAFVTNSLKDIKSGSLVGNLGH